MTDTAAAARLDRLIWRLIAAVAAVVLAAPLVSGFHIEVETFLTPATAALALSALAVFYGYFRPDRRLAAGLICTAQLITFAAVGAPLSYLAAAANLPLQDALFDRWDKALGLDWQALLALLNTLHALHAPFALAYMSLTVQMTTVVLCLAFSSRFLGLRIFMLAFIFAAVMTIAVSALLPAAGPWPYYGLTAADSPHFVPAVRENWLPVFHGLRDGSFRALVAIGSEGIIAFPSLHAALAVIVAVALWPVRYARWPALALNITMIAATPIDGSHYFVDVVAGVAVALLALVIAHKAAEWAARTPAEAHPEKIVQPAVPRQ
jgi:hypothetical protein